MLPCKTCLYSSNCNILVPSWLGPLGLLDSLSLHLRYVAISTSFWSILDNFLMVLMYLNIHFLDTNYFLLWFETVHYYWCERRLKKESTIAFDWTWLQLMLVVDFFLMKTLKEQLTKTERHKVVRLKIGSSLEGKRLTWVIKVNIFLRMHAEDDA